MNDLEKAKNLLKNKQYTFVAVSKGKIIKTSHERGVIPMLEIIRDYQNILAETVIADKIIGKAAALLLVGYKVKQIYAEILSQQAKEVLDQYSMFYQYGKYVDYIQNRSKNGQCPMEKLTQRINDPQIAYSNILQYYREVLNIDLLKKGDEAVK
jgi:hypothetical protein